MWVINARLPQVEGAILINAIDEIMDKQDKPMKPILGFTDKNVSAETPTPDIESDWVEHEVRIALAEEVNRNSTILVPIRIDSAVMGLL